MRRHHEYVAYHHHRYLDTVSGCSCHGGCDAEALAPERAREASRNFGFTMSRCAMGDGRWDGRALDDTCTG